MFRNDFLIIYCYDSKEREKIMNFWFCILLVKGMDL